MGWKRGPGDPAETRRNGRTYIPTREEMNEINRPAREAAERKQGPAKARRKK